MTNIDLTGSENIHITNNQIALTHPLKINNEAFLNPRVNGYFENVCSTKWYLNITAYFRWLTTNRHF